MLFRSLAALLLLLACGCPPPDETCRSDAEAADIVLGNGVGGAFEAYTDMQQVTIDVAPQGGFGVTTLVSTSFLAAGNNRFVDLQLDALIGQDLIGEFTLLDTPLLCRGEGLGGLVSGVVVGFDSDIYRTNDDLLQLDGETVTLSVSATDDQGATADIQTDVVVLVGG